MIEKILQHLALKDSPPLPRAGGEDQSGEAEIDGNVYEVYNDDSGVQLLVAKDVNTNFL